MKPSDDDTLSIVDNRSSFWDDIFSLGVPLPLTLALTFGINVGLARYVHVPHPSRMAHSCCERRR